MVGQGEVGDLPQEAVLVVGQEPLLQPIAQPLADRLGGVDQSARRRA